MVLAIKEAWQFKGCPICRLLERDEFDLMCHLQYQIIHDGETKEKIVAAHGYCNLHFYEMGRLSNSRTMAMIIKELIDQRINELSENHLVRLNKVECPICQDLREREKGYLDQFFALLAEDSFRKVYVQSDGLCPFHLGKILSTVKEEAMSQFLLISEENHLKNIRKNLENFLQKEKSKDKLSEREREAWWLGMQKLVGKRGF